MKGAVPWDVIVNVFTAVAGKVADAIKRRRAKKRGDPMPGDEGGHPVFPLDEARQKVRERRDGT